MMSGRNLGLLAFSADPSGAMRMGELRARPQGAGPLGAVAGIQLREGEARVGAEMERRGCVEKEFRRIGWNLEMG